MRELSDAAASVWAKSPRKGGLDWLPLRRHLDDSAAVAGRLWDHWLPAATRRLVAEHLPGGDADGRRLAVWLAGVHDIGKATPTFASQVHSLARPMRERGLAMLTQYPPHDRRISRHATTGQLLLERWLERTHGWTRPRQFAIVVGGHHGVPPTLGELEEAGSRPHLLGLDTDQRPWQHVQQELLDRAADHCGVTDRLPDWSTVNLSQPAQVLLTGLVIIADWIASNEDLFPYDPERLHLPSRLDDAWDGLNLPTPWQAVPATASAETLFATRFTLPTGAPPRPVQTAAVALAQTMPAAGLLVIEAPMGEGKTEAALAAAEYLAARTGAGGCLVALPTRATSDAMFARVKEWLLRVPDADREAGAVAVGLAHGKARFNDDFTALMWRGQSLDIDRDDPDQRDERDQQSQAGQQSRERRPTTREVAAHRWLAGRKKAMLASFVVGTIDQLLFGALKSRHLALRHLGLAGKVVIIDEAHAYDVYMSQYLDRALEWLAAYRVPTIVLSATLPARRRQEMIRAYDRGRGIAEAPAPSPFRRPWRRTEEARPDPYQVLAGDIGYPVLTASGADNQPHVRVAAASGRATEVIVERADDGPAALISLLRSALAEGGCALVVRNTVRRVQETAGFLRAALAGTGIEVSTAHSRFLAPDRSANDQRLRTWFGPPEVAGQARPQAHVVVASQVAEQSLDIDFDLLVTDLAPVDLVLQRAGRLHRHQRGEGQSQRPPGLRQARCVLTGVEDWSAQPPTPVAGSRMVYDEHALLRAAGVLHPYLEGERTLHLPVDIAPLVQTAYGDGVVGPAAWQPAMATARRAYDERQVRKGREADTFRLGPVGPAGTALAGWLAGHAGDADDDPRQPGRAQVRDTAAETVEVLVVVRRADGLLVTPPWLDRDGGRELPEWSAPPPALAKTVAACTLALPIQLCGLEAITELERAHPCAEAWAEARWLAGELVLVLDERGEATVHGHHLSYTRRDGLMVTRLPG